MGLLLLILLFLAQNTFAQSTPAPQSTSPRDVVVLVHGLLRTSASMYFLRRYLEQQGYVVYSYHYPSAKYGIHEHSRLLRRYVDERIRQHPHSRIHFVTHSMGGIVARDALAQLPPGQLRHINSLIMLAPPNQGSSLAKLTIRIFPVITSLIKPLAELSSDQNAYVHRVPVPKVKTGIIAGYFDAKVPPSFARLPGQAEPVVVYSTHTFIMNNAQTRTLISRFLKNGTFR